MTLLLKRDDTVHLGVGEVTQSILAGTAVGGAQERLPRCHQSFGIAESAGFDQSLVVVEEWTDEKDELISPKRRKASLPNSASFSTR